MAYFKLVITFLVYLIITKTSISQEIIHVASYETKAPVPYASIINYTNGKLLSTDASGNVTGNFLNGDSISISSVGYHKLDFIFHPSKVNNYLLKETVIVLPAIEIKDCKERISAEYTNLIADTTGRKFEGVGFSDASTNAKVAIYLNPPHTNSKLLAFSFWLKRFDFAPKTAINTPMKFSFYSVNDSTLLPGELLSNKQFIYTPQKEGKQTINVDTSKIRIPENGFFICIEYIWDEQYKWSYSAYDPETGQTTTKYNYGSLIDGVFSKGFHLAFYSYLKDLWIFPKGLDKSVIDRITGTIKFSITYSYCK